MILRSITPYHYGPFSQPATITLEDDITVITGANDVGKSVVLDAITELCQKTKLSESKVNTERFHESQTGSWTTDPEIKIAFSVVVEDDDKAQRRIGAKAEAADILHAEYACNSPGSNFSVTQVRRGNNTLRADTVRIHQLPTVIRADDYEEIGDVIDLSNPSGQEKRMLSLGFGPQFNAQDHASQRLYTRAARIRQAQDALNRRLSEVITGAYELSFNLIDVAGEGKKLAFGLADNSEGYVSFSQRGKGVRRAISLILKLMDVHNAKNKLILLDEPETSLHADAQHHLRRLLERLAQQKGTQVVYATHSPSMINPVKPRSVRVLSREKAAEFACVRVENNPYGENFQRVRTSLGLLPSDSLLYGSVTILVEGDTEVRCLEPVLNKLAENQINGFQRWPELSAECHFVGGRGDTIQKLVTVAKSQNANPIVLLDGDKTSLAERLSKIHEGLPILAFEAGKEFEDLVPVSTYIAAIAEVTEEQLKGRTLEIADYNDWLSTAGPNTSVLTSKRVNKWLKDAYDLAYTKHEVMEKAIEIAQPNEIQTSVLLHLLDEIEKITGLG